MKRDLISRGGCLPYNPRLLERSRELRKNMTPAEKKLWYHYLRDHQLTFHRQKIIDHYIADFYCSKALLVIEIDGDTHFNDNSMEYDANRTAILESYGLHVIRFTNEEIYNHFEEACVKIEDEVVTRLNRIEEKPPNPL
jgi:very-short-patch-repair endonuclease